METSIMAIPKLTPKGKEQLATLTPEQRTRLQRLATELWHTIAGDLMAAVAEEGKSSIPRADVIEVVCDAGRLQQDAKRKNWDDLIPFLDTSEYGAIYAAVLPAFPHTRYS
jgi:hypothetical protein